MARKVLFLHNDPSAPEALLGEAFAESGFDISTFAVVPADRADDPVIEVSFPDPLEYDVIVPLGACWAAYDERLPWIGAEMAMLRTALDAGAGVLGVCFGGQLLARALGGTVVRSPHPEFGWHEVHSDRTDLVPPGPWFQWHFDRLTPPPGAVEVARNDRATQAFVRGRAMGLQFHPEVDAELVERWIAEDAGVGDMDRLGVQPQRLRAHTAAVAADAADRLRLLVAGFVSLLAEVPEDVTHDPDGER
ncbi:MAG: type 1 glutamine amidotransferase [Mycobacterium sp.]